MRSDGGTEVLERLPGWRTRRYRGPETPGGVMSAQPDHAAPPSAPAPAAAAQLLAELRASNRAESWVPAFERDWAAALDDARHSYSLAPSTPWSPPGRPVLPPCPL
ncbi:DUF6247 family protein [Streptomyces sp. NPDC015139]|uniref:DUF6247 family protein n=1 Tax=Streptomyces sp. NPDC015139 TaxID=3364942 RepID=UPI00370271F3